MMLEMLFQYFSVSIWPISTLVVFLAVLPIFTIVESPLPGLFIL